MKCVRIVGQGIPVRLSDEDAHTLVNMGDGEYCSKGFWKAGPRLVAEITPSGGLRTVVRDV